ncbi:MAG: hypothetical protein H5U40_00915 [Polyangiaceae bacterium]|nr:hypothetical protein [Polyangiaceae bacterium]
MIAATAAASSIESDVRESLANGREAGGEVAAAAEARLGEAVESIDVSKAMLDAATDAEAAAWRPLASADDAADKAIGSVRDTMWNALGRAKQHPAMNRVFPGGIGTYTSGDPRSQAVLMEILKSRIEMPGAPDAWPFESRRAWSAEIAAAGARLAAAVEVHRPLDASLTVAHATYRATVRAAQHQLTKLKRDLQNLGLSETQIHAIIPDARRRSSAAKSPSQKAAEPAE